MEHDGRDEPIPLSLMHDCWRQLMECVARRGVSLVFWGGRRGCPCYLVINSRLGLVKRTFASFSKNCLFLACCSRDGSTEISCHLNNRESTRRGHNIQYLSQTSPPMHAINDVT